MDRTRELQLLAAAVVLSLLLGMWIANRWGALRSRLRGRAHNRRGQRGERNAERLLRKHGYAIVARQAHAAYPVRLGDEWIEVDLHADFLVERAGRRFVAEVKTGRAAPRFENAETRRQLLEYQVAFGVQSVLLVDGETGELREVSFPLSPGETSPVLAYVVVAALSAGLCWLLMGGAGQ